MDIMYERPEFIPNHHPWYNIQFVPSLVNDVIAEWVECVSLNRSTIGV